MDRYFQSIVDRLTLDEIELMNYLSKGESNSRLSAKMKRDVFEESKLSEAKFRKIINRLEAMNFIEIVVGSKDHFIFVNEYGQNAIQYIYDRRG